jgi:hypothetical protein
MIALRKTVAFTLVEVMVAMAVTIMIVTLLVTIASSTSSAWQRGEGQAETFASARGALALVGRELQGAVIDQDLGYVIQPVTGSPNNFVLKFISRRVPKGTEKAAVEKVAYQLAWAGPGLVPEVKGSYDENHSLPVLIRTTNFTPDKANGLNDVFKIASGRFAWDWVRKWGTLAPSATIQTGQQDTTTGDITEVVAENVLGWRINPIYWDSATGKKKIVIDDPNVSPRYYDDTKINANPTGAKPPKYITSDLRYVKKSEPALANITTDTAPRAIEIRVLVVPSSTVTRLKALQGWSSTRETSGLFDVLTLPDNPFNNLLKQHARSFDATYYLSSKTP